jgi:hypothetical protein
MKNQKNRQKLTLSRETLRRLESSELVGVAGGTVVTCIPARCTSGLAPTADVGCCSADTACL